MHPDLLPAVAERRALADELATLAASLRPDEWDLPTENPGWSRRDVLAHLASGDWVMHGILRGALAGRDLTALWESIDVDAGNAERIAERRARAIDELLAELRRQQTQTLALWEMLQDRHLQAILPHWSGGFCTVREYLLGFAGHDRYHIGQLRAGLTYSPSPRP